jgi:hypothetical protein
MAIGKVAAAHSARPLSVRIATTTDCWLITGGQQSVEVMELRRIDTGEVFL